MVKPGLVGRTVAGRFLVTELLGEGGMASVYRATDTRGGADVALKLMHDHLARGAEFQRRFLREGKVLAKLRGPNVVRVLDVGIDAGIGGGQPFIAMELVRGRDLGSVLSHAGRLDPIRALKLMLQLCAALEEAHRLGIVHRDLKPENLLLERLPEDPQNERLKVLDFGIAKIVDPDFSAEGGAHPPSTAAPSSALTRAGLTRAGVLVGTPEYMSPEQCRGAPVDARSDIYACGVILFELLTGKCPIEGPTPIHVTINQVEQPPSSLSAFLPDVDPRIEALVLRMLAKDPAERPQSARALAKELQSIGPRVTWPPLLPSLDDGAEDGAGVPNLAGEPESDAAATTVMEQPPVHELGELIHREVVSRPPRRAPAAAGVRILATEVKRGAVRTEPFQPEPAAAASPVGGAIALAPARPARRLPAWVPVAIGVAVGLATAALFTLAR